MKSAALLVRLGELRLVQVSEVWKEQVCGDGVCDSPLEFKAFGELGCKTDCGYVECTLAEYRPVLKLTDARTDQMARS